MLKVIKDSTLSAIGDALREKIVSTDTYLPSEMAPSIVNYTIGYDQIAKRMPAYAHGITDTIAPSAFAGLSDMITGVDFPNCESVGSYAFSNCTLMSEVSLPSCRTIGEGAFISCNAISTLSLPVCEVISNKAFISCTSLTNISVPNLTVLGTNTDIGYNGPFESCIRLTSAYVPNLTNILDRAFCNCFSLSELSISKCTLLGAYALTATAITSVDVPECVSIGAYCFANCSSLLYAHASSCISISNYAFRDCINISDISFTACTSVGNYAFWNCPNISAASFPECSYVGSSAFRIAENVTQFFSSLKYAYFPKCTFLGQCAFVCQTGMSYVHFPVLSSVLFATFWGCSGLTSIDFPECRSITGHDGYGAFERCELLETVSMAKCEFTGNRAFLSCHSLRSVSMPRCSLLGNLTFMSCGLLSDVFVPMCRSLYGSTFLNCSSLESLSLPALEYIRGYYTISGTRILTLSLPMLKAIQEQHALRSCSTLMSLYMLGPMLATMSNVNDLYDTPMSNSTYTGTFGSIYVPEWMYSSYITAPNWSNYSARFVSVPLQSFASKVDVFNGEISAYHSVGVEFLDSDVVDSVANIRLKEWSAGHEGFQVEMTGFEVGKVYRLSFDLQFIDAMFFAQTSYCVGFKVEQYPVTSYDAYSNWPNNLVRDLDEHHYQWVFEPPVDTMYLSFEFDGLADRSDNAFKIRNLMVEEVRWDIANL